MTIDEVRTLLEQIQFPKRYISEQTAICVMALADRSERDGLLSGHRNLSEGARIHDILNFARDEVRKKVAENTREAYRKTSLAPLMNSGIIVRHQLSTNDPNTYYRLHPDYAALFAEKYPNARKRLIRRLQVSPARAKDRRVRLRRQTEDVRVRLDAELFFALSPGEHNLLEKAVVESFARAFLGSSSVVYLGDTAPRSGYQHRALMRKLNLPIETSTALPDVIILSASDTRLVVVEAVTNSGPVTQMRLSQLEQLTKGPRKLGYKVEYITAFPSRSVFRRFVEEIAWGSSVWIENEPNNIVHFEKVGV